jgi:hypothetical protein
MLVIGNLEEYPSYNGQGERTLAGQRRAIARAALAIDAQVVAVAAQGDCWWESLVVRLKLLKILVDEARANSHREWTVQMLRDRLADAMTRGSFGSLDREAVLVAMRAECAEFRRTRPGIQPDSVTQKKIDLNVASDTNVIAEFTAWHRTPTVPASELQIRVASIEFNMRMFAISLRTSPRARSVSQC